MEERRGCGKAWMRLRAEEKQERWKRLLTVPPCTVRASLAHTIELSLTAEVRLV